MTAHTRLLGARIDRVTLAEATEVIHGFIESGAFHQVLTANVDFIRLARADQEFRTILKRGDLVVADGMPLVWASRWARTPLPERVTGVDLTDRCCALAVRHGYSVFLLGGEAGVADAAAAALTARYPGLRIAGTYAPPIGPFSAAENGRMIAQVRAAAPHILLVAFGAPKQDLWIATHRAELAVPVAIGVGGVFNFLTGRVRRAPAWMQRHGLEWLYRVLREPGRLWRRYVLLDMPVVAALALEATRRRIGGAPRRREPQEEHA